MKPLLSILIPSVPERAYQAMRLVEKLDHPSVEVLVFTDNKKRSVGGKRQTLLEMARGEYVAFVDDDDDISDDYLSELLPRCASGPDVVTFEQEASINGVVGKIVFDATAFNDEPWRPNGFSRRRPWHVCAWRRRVALQGVFTEVNYGEDAAWVNQVAPLAKNTLHIPKVLHRYIHSEATTLAPAPL